MNLILWAEQQPSNEASEPVVEAAACQQQLSVRVDTGSAHSGWVQPRYWCALWGVLTGLTAGYTITEPATQSPSQLHSHSFHLQGPVLVLNQKRPRPLQVPETEVRRHIIILTISRSSPATSLSWFAQTHLEAGTLRRPQHVPNVTFTTILIEILI